MLTYYYYYQNNKQLRPYKDYGLYNVHSRPYAMIYFAIWVKKLFNFLNIINETNMIDY